MNDTVRVGGRFGTGPLSRAMALVYSLLVVELLLVLTTLPGLLPLLLLLDRDASNLPLVALCLLPVGPAVSAALYALRHHRPDLADLRPAALFWRGYRANVRGVLAIWLPWLLWLTVVGLNLNNFGAAGVPGWWRVPLLLVALGVTLWGINALVITSLFTFRIRDVARLALHFLGHAPGVTLGNACLLVVAAGIVWLSSEAVLGLLGSVLTLALLRNSRPLVGKVEEEFTA
ncbi:DUF624 domain-containing protein [Plantactinospora endophytica]|uniref:DUF624 domain-containing protein n=1 Tax=Plantactinospora endophytica TaxID=673535 RepID=A0ABQ4EBZ7_9ACTN|nr:DUF624 domain-containing protein [Plantactinospora endophytica]GIG92258.1 hypothetical protein Pen02_71940 [Plantactinospora endophytica]